MISYFSDFRELFLISVCGSSRKIFFYKSSEDFGFVNPIFDEKLAEKSKFYLLHKNRDHYLYDRWSYSQENHRLRIEISVQIGYNDIGVYAMIWR